MDRINLIIAVIGAICAAVFFTFGMKAITSSIVIEVTHEPTKESFNKVSSLIIKAIFLFSIAFVLIMATHN